MVATSPSIGAGRSEPCNELPPFDHSITWSAVANSLSGIVRPRAFAVLRFVQAGLMLWAQVGLQHAVEMAARCASLSDIAIKYGSLNPATTECYSVNGNATANASTVKSFAANNAWGTNPPSSAFSVDAAAAACPGGNLVTATYPFTAITYLFPITLTAQSCYPRSS
jgi:hypothetical protein